MPKNYRAKITFDLSGAPKRQYRRILEVVSATVFARPETAGAMLFGSEKDRSVSIMLSVDSNSSSAADSKIDTFIRRMIYAIDPHSGVRTQRRPGITEESVSKELIRVAS